MSLEGKQIAILAGPDYEDSELHYPRLRLIEEGAKVVVLAVEPGLVKGKHGWNVMAKQAVAGVSPDDFDAVVIPGGWAPDRLRRYVEVLEFVRSLDRSGKVVAAICHGPQVIISAGLLRGKRATCVSAIKDDVINAGARYEDSPVVRDGNLITSRVPRDLPFFCKEIIKALSQ